MHTLPMPTVADVETWYAARNWRVFEFQRECWAAYAAGQSGLIHAPTGAGKTLAAWIAALLQARGADEPRQKIRAARVGNEPQILGSNQGLGE